MTAASGQMDAGGGLAGHAGVPASVVMGRPSILGFLGDSQNRVRHDSEARARGGYGSRHLREITESLIDYAHRSDRGEALKRARADAITNGYTSAQLRFIEAEIFKKEYPPLFFREVLGPCIVGVPEGYRNYTWRQTTGVGEAAPITNDTDDAPSVDLFLEEFDQRFQAYGVAYGYSAMDMATEAVGQMPITIEKGQDCIDRMERRFEAVAKTGDASFKLKGFFNHEDVPVVGTTSGYTPSLSTNWLALIAGTDANKTTFINSFSTFLQAIVNGSNAVEVGPFVVCVGLDLWFALANTPRSSLSDTTLLTFLKGNNPLLRDIVYWPALSTADVAGTGNRVIAFTRDPRKVKFLEAVRFKSMPPRERGSFGYSVGNYGVIGGVIMPKPRAMAYIDVT